MNKPNRVPALTEEQEKEFQRAAHRTWQTIGGDCLQALADDKGKDVNRVTMPRDEVIEVVLDAGYMLMYGEIKDPAVRTFAEKGDYEAQKKLLRKEFTLGRYGM